jgi:hypothetical protein
MDGFLFGHVLGIHLFKNVLAVIDPPNSGRIHTFLVIFNFYGIVTYYPGGKKLGAAHSFELKGSCFEVGAVPFHLITRRKQ